MNSDLVKAYLKDPQRGPDVKMEELWRYALGQTRPIRRADQMLIANWLRAWGYVRVSVRSGRQVHRVWRNRDPHALDIPIPVLEEIERERAVRLGTEAMYTRSQLELRRWLKDMKWTPAQACGVLQEREADMQGWLRGVAIPLTVQLAMRWMREHSHDATSVTESVQTGVDNAPPGVEG